MIKLCLGCFKFKTFGYFRHRLYWLKHGEKQNSNGGAAILSADGAKVPGVSLKVRFCSPLVAGYMFLVGVALDYPQLLSSSTSQCPSCTNLLGEFFCTYFYEFISVIVYVQTKCTSLKYIFFAHCLEA